MFRLWKSTVIVGLVVICGMASWSPCWAGNRNDTVFVCKNFPSTLIFNDPVTDVRANCEKGEYLFTKKAFHGNGKLEVSLGDEHPKDTACVLIVTEGNAPHERKHRFTVYRALELEPENAVYYIGINKEKAKIK